MPVGGTQSHGPCEQERFSLTSLIFFWLESNDSFFFSLESSFITLCLYGVGEMGGCPRNFERGASGLH